MKFERQLTLPVSYGDFVADGAFRVDFIVEKDLIVELKSVETLTPLHRTQLTTYLKLAGIRKGLLINFNVTLLKRGLKSVVL